MKKSIKAYVVSKVQKGRRYYQKGEIPGEWTDNLLDSFFFKDKKSATKSMDSDMKHWQPYYEQYKEPVHWELFEIDINVIKI